MSVLPDTPSVSGNTLMIDGLEIRGLQVMAGVGAVVLAAAAVLVVALLRHSKPAGDETASDGLTAQGDGTSPQSAGLAEQRAGSSARP